MSSFTNLKDPDEVLDYGLDLTDWLEDGATVASATWTVSAGLTEDSESTSSPTSAVMVSGGTANTSYSLKGAITDSDGRVMVRRISVYCVNR